MLKLLGLKMDSAVVHEFLNFFQDYINLCQLENWPTNDTCERELKNAFLMSQHIEKCLDKLQKRGVLDEFLSVLNSFEDTSSSVIKNCLLNPPKHVLKKVINSNTKINQMDTAFRLFLELFTEDKLEICLTELMHEAACKETLMSNLPNYLTKDIILKFKSKVLLTELCSDNSGIVNLMSNCNQTVLELLVFCLLNNEPKFSNAVRVIADAFLEVVMSKNNVNKSFWSLLFKVDEKYLIEMCVENSDIYTYIVEALIDCGKLLREGMSAESFYIDLGEMELKSIVQRICSKDYLKSQFFDIVKDNDANVEFWQNIL